MINMDLNTKDAGLINSLIAIKNYCLNRFNPTVQFHANCSNSTREKDKVYHEKKYYPNGIIKKETVYLNQKKHGVEKEYDLLGQLIKETPYEYNKKNGTQRIYRHGKLLLEIPYIDDKKHGMMKGYYNNKMSIILYNHGRISN